MKIYKVFYKEGGEAKGLTIKVSDHGKIKIVSNKELTLGQLVRGGRIPKDAQNISESKLKKDGTPKKKPGRPKKDPITAPVISVSDTTATTQQAPSPIVEIPADEADIVSVGDSIEFTLNGDATVGEITKEYPDTQELEVKIKGGLKIVIPVSLFVRKV